jgi:hypothetical protein
MSFRKQSGAESHQLPNGYHEMLVNELLSFFLLKMISLG